MAPHFPTVSQKDLRDSRGEKSCSVCCVDYADGHIPVRTPCNHIFGQNCLAAWLVDNDTCPMCRTNIGDRRSSRHHSSRRDEPSTRSRAGTEAPRTSARPQPSRIETLRHEHSARPRASTSSSNGGAPSRLSVSSSQWSEDASTLSTAREEPSTRSSHRDSCRTTREAPTSSSRRVSHTLRTAREEPSTRSSHRDSSRTTREAPTSSSHRDSHTLRTAREEPSTRSSHRDSHTSRTAREEPSARSSYRSDRDSHTSRTAREAPPSSSHRSSHTARDAPSHRSSHRRSSHSSRAASNQMTSLANLIRSSRIHSSDQHANILARGRNHYPAFSRERLFQLLEDDYIKNADEEECTYIADQLEASDIRETRGEDPFERHTEYMIDGSRADAPIRIPHGYTGGLLSPRSVVGAARDTPWRQAGLQETIRALSDGALADAIRRLRV